MKLKVPIVTEINVSHIAENHPFEIHPHHLTADGRAYSLRREPSKRTLIFRTK